MNYYKFSPSQIISLNLKNPDIWNDAALINIYQVYLKQAADLAVLENEIIGRLQRKLISAMALMGEGNFTDEKES